LEYLGSLKKKKTFPFIAQNVHALESAWLSCLCCFTC